MGLSLGGTLNGAQFAAGASGAISGVLTVAMAIGGCIEGYRDIMQASVTKVVDKVMDPNWSNKLIRDGDNNIYRYNGSYSGGEYDDTEDYFANLVWEVFQQSSAYNQLVDELKIDGYTDIYFIGGTFGGAGSKIDPQTGLNQGGTNGQTESLAPKEVYRTPQPWLLALPDPILNKANEGAQLGRKSIIIRTNDAYFEALAYIVNNLPKNAETLNIFTFVMEQAVYTMSHEIKAHALNALHDIDLSSEKEHAKYNHDGLESRSSPFYITIPMDGKSQSSRDKIEIHRILKKYKRKWGNI